MKIYVLNLIFLMISFSHFAQSSKEDKMIHAVLTGDLIVARSLLDTGMDPHLKNDKNKPLLLLATENNNVEMVDLLLNKGAKVDYPFDDVKRIKEQEAINSKHATPFLYAAAHGFPEVIDRLIKSKPNLDIVDYYGGNAIIPAAERGHYQTAKIILEKTDINIDLINYLGWTAMLEVVLLSKNKDMQVKMAKLLLDHHADLSIKDKDGVDALTHAKNGNNKKLVEVLESY